MKRESKSLVIMKKSESKVCSQMLMSYKDFRKYVVKRKIKLHSTTM